MSIVFESFQMMISLYHVQLPTHREDNVYQLVSALADLSFCVPRRALDTDMPIVFWSVHSLWISGSSGRLQGVSRALSSSPEG